MLKIKYQNNIILDNKDFGNISIDPIKKKNNFDINFITHAHKDHVGPRTNENSTYFATKPTLEIVNKLFKENRQGKVLEYNKKYKIDDLEYKIINSGHVFGSYSLVLEYNGTKITITSDINTENTTTTTAAIPEDTDILIIESTYGSEKDIFPKRKNEYTRFLKWLILNRLNNNLPIISSYPLGKTQEILKLICDNTNFNIGLTNDAYEISEIYKKHKIGLKNYFRVNGNINDLDLLILPPQKIKKDLIDALSTIYKRNLVFASTTGNAFRLGTQFKISDHCDITGLTKYIQESNAKQIYTYHGKDKEFANFISKKLKLFARPLKDIKKLEIT